MNYLWMCLLGGKAPGATVELHDIVFLISPTIEEAYPRLKKKWFASPSSTHLDGWMKVEQVDGFDIHLSQEKPQVQDQQLYFVNIGSYPPGRLEESHDYRLWVGTNEKEVKDRARRQAAQQNFQPHKDNLILIDDVFAVKELDGYFIHLSPAQNQKKNEMKADYIPL